MIRARTFLLAVPCFRFLLTALLATLLGGADLSAQESAPYQPSRGQSGKDVIWIPTPDGLVTRMLRLAQVTDRDYVVDLGAGDGKIVIAAARDFGARGLGLEYEEKMVGHARRNATEAGVSDRAEFRQADIFATDFSSANVVTMYLLPNLNLRLRPTLMAMKPGTRLVSHQFTMGDWQPDETSWVEGRPAYLWIVPANAGGTWQASFPRSNGTATAELKVDQSFQKVIGSLEFDGVRTSLRSAQVEGARLQFGFTDNDGVVRRVEATIAGNRMKGTLTGPSGDVTFNAQRAENGPPIGGAAPVSGDEVSGSLQLLGE